MSTKYTVDQIINTKYTNAPVKRDKQYRVGQTIDITEENFPNEIIARFCVLKTDDTNIEGRITQVYPRVGSYLNE